MSSVHDVAASLVRDGSVLIAPTMDADGYWFGAGNAAVRPTDGRVFLIGRYRDGGDSTTALAKVRSEIPFQLSSILRQGTRGRELALFDITDPSRPAKVRSWSKSDLGRGGSVLSIEGSAIAFESDGAVIVAVGTEKEAEYPDAVRDFRKPGTGVWSIDAFYAPSVDALDPRTSLVRLIDSDDPEHLHVKDPSLVKRADGDYDIYFCIHSFSWTEGALHLARKVAYFGSKVTLDAPAYHWTPLQARSSPSTSHFPSSLAAPHGTLQWHASLAHFPLPPSTATRAPNMAIFPFL